MSMVYGDFITKDYCANFYNDNKYLWSVMFSKCTQRCKILFLQRNI